MKSCNAKISIRKKELVRFFKFNTINHLTYHSAVQTTVRGYNKYRELKYTTTIANEAGHNNHSARRRC